MILRAIFWIGLVSILIPRTPELGPARAHDSLLGAARTDHTSLAIATLRVTFLDRLMQIKAEIEADQKARIARGN